MDLGRNIYFYRNQKGFSQELLADMINVSRQTIYKWENNVAVPRADHIILLVKCLNISYNELFDEELFSDSEEIDERIKVDL